MHKCLNSPHPIVKMTGRMQSSIERLCKSIRITLTLTVLLMISACKTAPAEAVTSNKDSGPLGLWVWQAPTQDSELDVVLQKFNNGWQARVNGKDVDTSVTGQNLTLAIDHQHTFSGTFTQDRNRITGYWTQSFTALAYSVVNTRFSLHYHQPNTWHGKVILQPRPFHVYLDIFEEPETGLQAVIRNPERNDIMGATRFDVTETGKDEWLLSRDWGNRTVKVPVKRIARQEQQHKEPQQLQMNYSRLEDPIVLTPATQVNHHRYYPRPPNQFAQAYTPPVDLNDGWSVVAASEVGMDEATLKSLAQKLASADPRDARPTLVHAMSISYKGKLVFDEYFYGHNAQTVHDTRSLAKVFGSVMMGAMQQRSYNISPQDQPMTELFSQAGLKLQNAQKKDITLAHLMTYTSGLDCDANRPSSKGSEDRMWTQQKEANYWLFTAKLPLLHPPGDRYAYCSGSANLVGASISKVTGLPVYEAFHQLIGQPLQFDTLHWNLMPNGEGYLGGGVYMRPRDILKIGAVFAGNGTWNGKQIISPDWIQESTSSKIAITPATTGMKDNDFYNAYFGGGQAYFWRTDTVKTAHGEYDSYEATGNGGQILLVVPELELSVVFTGGNYYMGSIWGKWRNELVGGYVIPAITKNLM